MRRFSDVHKAVELVATSRAADPERAHSADKSPAENGERSLRGVLPANNSRDRLLPSYSSSFAAKTCDYRQRAGR